MDATEQPIGAFGGENGRQWIGALDDSPADEHTGSLNL